MTGDGLDLSTSSESSKTESLQTPSATDFGETLRRLRESRGFSLSAIATDTKISVWMLEALERNDVSRLPGGVFSRGFVRSYVQAIGLDPEPVVREFVERFQPDDHRTQHTAAHAQAEYRETRRHGARVALKLVAVSLPFAAAIGYLTMTARAPAEESTPMTDQASVEAVGTGAMDTMVSRSESSFGESSTLPNGPQAPGLAAAAESTRGLASANPDVLHVVMRTTRTCWVSVTTDGHQAFARLMVAGDEETQQVRGEIVVRVGDAGGFGFWINDVPGQPLGGSGEVATARINRENYETFLRR